MNSNKEPDEKAIKSLAKAWPILAQHANHIDGEFDNALTYVKNRLTKLRGLEE